MHPKELKIEDFTYDLPDARIARYPLAERDASKLLVYRKGVITEHVYRDFATQIPEGSLMVFNQTRVVHARLIFRKESGSVIEVFCLAPHEQYTDIHTAMQQKRHVLWECMVGGASKWKAGIVLQHKNDTPLFTLSARIEERRPGSFILSLEWDDETLTFAEVLQYAGKVPLPPYLQREADATDETRYQTLFAREEGSVAAPTAGLHFTHHVLSDLTAKKVDSAFVTLHVGAGTFKPVKSAVMADHDMHAEWIDVTADTLQKLRQNLGGNIVAVGTTSLRTLESLYWIGNKLAWNEPVDLHGTAVTQWEPYDAQWTVTPERALEAITDYMSQQGITRLVTRTQILIAPGYSFRIVKGLATNFHQPQSTLLLLVSAFIGADWRRVYEHALANDYRFLSYGDGCLLWR